MPSQKCEQHLDAKHQDQQREKELMGTERHECGVPSGRKRPTNGSPPLHKQHHCRECHHRQTHHDDRPDYTRQEIPRGEEAIVGLVGHGDPQVGDLTDSMTLVSHASKAQTLHSTPEYGDVRIDLLEAQLGNPKTEMAFVTGCDIEDEVV